VTEPILPIPPAGATVRPVDRVLLNPDEREQERRRREQERKKREKQAPRTPDGRLDIRA
jgi:hypothetical protein